VINEYIPQVLYCVTSSCIPKAGDSLSEFAGDFSIGSRVAGKTPTRGSTEEGPLLAILASLLRQNEPRI
jgi:hypothetical protein